MCVDLDTKQNLPPFLLHKNEFNRKKDEINYKNVNMTEVLCNNKIRRTGQGVTCTTLFLDAGSTRCGVQST